MATVQNMIDMAKKVDSDDCYYWWNKLPPPTVPELTGKWAYSGKLTTNGRDAKGADMSKFTEWLMEMYPKTEDYVYMDRKTMGGDPSRCGSFSAEQLYLLIKPDPQAFLEQMKDFDEMMEED